MTHITRSFFAASIVVLFASSMYAQSNSFPWPMSGAIGIGTKISPPFLPQNLLHLHSPDTLPDSEAVIRLSEGDSTTSQLYATMGLMRSASDTQFTSLSRGADFVLHEHSQGDMIFTNWQSTSLEHPFGAIRFATSPPASILPTITPGHHDLERLTILQNGNIGIDLPPDSSIGGLGNPKDQVVIGGGVVPYPGNTAPDGPLTIYGGNRFENMPYLGGVFNGGWRYIGFNQYTDHILGTATRFSAESSSAIAFAPASGGLLNFSCDPYDSTLGKSDFSKNLTMQMTGSQGMQVWYARNDSDQFHALFDIWVPGYSPSWDSIRNDSGLCMVRTPLYIGKASGYVPNFTDLGTVNPAIGDGHTWMLAVDGPALAKEFFVSLQWPDYVFLPNFPLFPLEKMENYLATNHHLPDIPSAKTMDSTGVALGKTEAAITKQLEEAMLYIVQLNKEVKELQTEIQELKSKKENQQ